MNTTTTLVPTATALATSTHPVVAVRGDEIEVSAATPNEMAQSQDALIEWARRKVAVAQDESRELHDSYTHAIRLKYRSDVLKRHAALADKREQFYRKMLAALGAGYIIVPTFPVDVFAVRTDQESPRGVYVSSYDYGLNPNLGYLEQKPKPIAEGEGEYRNPFPAVWRNTFKEGETTKRQYHATDWKEMEFPMNMAKPNIMEATDRAMMKKIFDEFGVLPGATKKVDPIIVGRIKVPCAGAYTERVVTFLIAWHLNTKTI